MKNNRNHYTKAMKVLAAFLALAVSLTACGSSASTETKETEESTEVETEVTTEAVETTEAAAETYAAPEDFTKGYKQADYAYYSDEENVESAKGDKIWIDGTVIQTQAEYFDDLNSYILCVALKDNDNNIWLVMVDKANGADDTNNYEDNYAINGVTIAGVYLGVSESKPVIVTNKYFFVKDGTTKTSSAFGSYNYTASDEAAETETEEAASEAADNSSDSNDISPEFKAAMDEYEAFFDEYVDFLANYDASDTSQALKYLSFLSEYAETLQAFEEWDDKEMNDAEALYYAEVSLRISEKLMKVGESLGG